MECRDSSSERSLHAAIRFDRRPVLVLCTTEVSIIAPPRHDRSKRIITGPDARWPTNEHCKQVLRGHSLLVGQTMAHRARIQKH